MANEIEALDENTFDKMVNVEFIGLTINKLSVIPENLFKNNLKLASIEFHNNRIQVINGSMFDHLNDVTVFELGKNNCVDNSYAKIDFTVMKDFLRKNCSSAV